MANPKKEGETTSQKPWRRDNPKDVTSTISIYGSSALAGSILNCGLLMNLFSPVQKISYQIFQDSDLYKIRHSGFLTGNQDSISCFSTHDENLWQLLADSDIIIIADRLPLELFQTIAVSCHEKKIFYYTPVENDVCSYIQIGNLKAFGMNHEILTDENIRHQKLVEKAKELHKAYLGNGIESNWDSLSGFLKWSNISLADYIGILTELMQDSTKMDDDVYAELEHIRWCRFHYLNYWKYGEFEGEERRNAELRLHRCLKPFSELADAEKKKDRDMIERLHNSYT